MVTRWLVMGAARWNLRIWCGLLLTRDPLWLLKRFAVIRNATVTQRDGRIQIHLQFHSRVTFAGELAVEETIKCDSALAKAVLSAWWKKHRHELEMFQERYRDVKEIGQRSIGTRPSGSFALRTARGPRAEDIHWDNVVDQQPATLKVGRNAACPCGSGKKYKKCCLPKLATSL